MKYLLQECVGKRSIVKTKQIIIQVKGMFKDIEMSEASERASFIRKLENDITDMLKVIKFRKVKNQFLTKLKSDIKTVKQS